MYKLLKINMSNKRLKTLVKIISILIYIITIPIIIFNITLIIKSYINPNETPSFFGYKNYTIVSKSMENTINKNDVIIVKEVPQSKISKNDIIAFFQNDEIITHRIVNIVEDAGNIKYVTKGDNNLHEDKKLVTYEQIEGKYQFKINGFGVVLKILKNPITLIILIIILILNCLYGYNRKRKKEIRKQKRQMYNEKVKNNENLNNDKI